MGESELARKTVFNKGVDFTNPFRTHQSCPPCESNLLSTPCAAALGGSDGSLAVERGGWVAGWLAKLLFGDLAGGMAELLDGWRGWAGWLAGLDWLSTVIACPAVCRLVLLVCIRLAGLLQLVDQLQPRAPAPPPRARRGTDC